MSSKKDVAMPGVAKGKKLSSVPIEGSMSAEDRVLALLGGSVAEDTYEGWGSKIFREMTLLSAGSNPGHTTFRYTVGSEHCNRLGNLHGGCTATLFDLCTTCALAPIAKEGFWAYAGVSRTLNVTYLRPIPLGETVLIESEVVHAGKRLCAIKGVMKRESDGALMATCEHGKVSIDPEFPKL